MRDRKAYRSKWLLTDPWTVLENGYVETAGGIIESVGAGSPPKDVPVVDMGPGVMMPSLVNAHTHLELSALSGSLSFDLGFRHWTTELIQKRGSFTESDLLEGALKALRSLLSSGCGAVGEISTLGITHTLFQDMPLAGVFFREYLGSTLPEIAPIDNTSLPLSSLAAHAPHTTAPAVIRNIKEITAAAGLPVSIHLGESEDEFLFIQSARGEWADFLTSRGIDFSGWPLPAKSPVQYLHGLGVLDEQTLAVHLLYCSQKDMRLLQDKNASICFCPRSNFLLHEKLPDIPSFIAQGFKPCLGTDSLASSPSLSILDEMAFVSARYCTLSPSDILAMGSIYGANGLGLGEKFGRLAPGCPAPPHYLDIEVNSSRAVIQTVVTSGNPELHHSLEKADKT